MRRPLRALCVAAIACLLATPVHAPPPLGPGAQSPAGLRAEAVALRVDAPDDRSFGPLRYVGGWVLASDDRRFGAISALAADGDRLIALSDQGLLFRITPPPASGLEIVPLADGPGRADNKVDRDGESLTLAGGAFWVGYENSNAIWRYDAASLRATGQARPPAMRRWGANRGAEAMTRLTDGRFLVVREDVDDQGVSDAVLFSGDPVEAGTQTISLKIDPPEQERVTDAAQLPDGRLLFVTRRLGMWSGWAGHLLIGRLPEENDRRIATQIAAEFDGDITRDNMEAIAISQEGGRTIVWIASDDNLFALQRTLLLKFEWVG